MNLFRSRKIGDLVETVSTWNPTTQAKEPFQYVELSAVDQETKCIIGATLVEPDTAPSRARQLIKTDDVLVSTVRPNLNAVARVTDFFEGATASTGFCVLRPAAEKLDPTYLFHWVRSPSFVDDMVRQATGASYPAISDRIVKSSLIPLPPLDEQRRIAAILDKADALRQKRNRAIALLDSLTQSIFLEMFGDLIANINSVKTLPLSAMIVAGDRLNYGVVQPGDNFDHGVPLIRVSDLRDGRVDRSDLKRIRPEISDEYKRSLLNGSEILVSCVGSIGEVALASGHERGFNIARAVARIPLDPIYSRVYVSEFLRSKHVQSYFLKESRTVSQPTLNIKQLSETLVPLPSKKLASEFEDRVSVVVRLRAQSEIAAKQQHTFFASLQHRAFSGQL